MILRTDIMVRMHRGQITASEALGAQASLDAGSGIPALPSRAPCRGTLATEYAAAASWIEANGTRSMRERLQIHRETCEPRRPEIEGGDGTLRPCDVRRMRLRIIEVARGDGAHIVDQAEPEPQAAEVDLVVPLGTGSRRGDLELRYLLRSARENLQGLRRIHVIGPRRPAWLVDQDQVRWVNWRPDRRKNVDIVTKFLAAARDPEVLETFIATCDDWLFLAPVRPGVDWGTVDSGHVLSTNWRGSYWDRCQAGTRRVLEAAGLPVVFYDQHAPTVQTKAGWVAVDRRVRWRGQVDHAVWSLYHNTAGTHGPAVQGRHSGWHAGDGSRRPGSVEEIAAALEGKWFTSYNDSGLNEHMEAWLAQRFPAPAPWEAGAHELPAGVAIAAATKAERVTVVTVLRTGGKYAAEHVRWLCDQVTAKVRTPHRFVCLTDVPDQVPGGVPLQGRLPGWWSKVELWQPGLFADGETVLFLDLDTVLCRAFEVPEPGPGELRMLSMRSVDSYVKWGSGAMLWKAPIGENWHRDFLERAQAPSEVFPGDQEWVVACASAAGLRITDLGIPFELRTKGAAGTPKPQTALATWIWGPKPWDIRAPWIPPLKRQVRTALVYAVFGDDSRRAGAAESGLRAMMARLKPRPAVTVLWEATPAPRYAGLCAELGMQHRWVQTGPRHERVWQKEPLYNLAAAELRATRPDVSWAIFCDADLEAAQANWIETVEEGFRSGIDVLQPFHWVHDRSEPSVDAEAQTWKLWQRVRGWGAPGFAWGVSLEWLARAGGWPVQGYLGSGDTLACHAWIEGMGPLHGYMPGWANAIITGYTGPRVPPRCIEAELIHHSHGTRGARGYAMQQCALRVAAPTREAIWETDAQGLEQVRDVPAGRAWQAWVAGRATWVDDEAEMARQWEQILATAEAEYGAVAAETPDPAAGTSGDGKRGGP